MKFLINKIQEWRWYAWKHPCEYVWIGFWYNGTFTGICFKRFW